VLVVIDFNGDVVVWLAHTDRTEKRKRRQDKMAKEKMLHRKQITYDVGTYSWRSDCVAVE